MSKKPEGVLVDWTVTSDGRMRKAFGDSLPRSGEDKRGILRCRSGHAIEGANVAPSGDGVQCRKCSQVYNRLHYYAKKRGYWWLQGHLALVLNKAPHTRLPEAAIRNKEPEAKLKVAWERKLKAAK